MLTRIFISILAITVWPALSVQAVFDDCSDDWIITGYYVPSESDFSAEKEKIVTIDNTTRMVKKDFSDTVLIEGSGKMDSGEILEWYENAWHLNSRAEDYFGDELTFETVAVDPDVIPFYSRLIIPSLQAPFNTRIFTASDIGPSIKNKHIDVFVGYGEFDYKQAWLFPENNTVCLESSVSVIDEKIGERLSGRILLAIENNGEAWYVNPIDKKRYYLGRPADAFRIMTAFGLGVKREFIVSQKIFPDRVSGKILINVDDNGRAYYVSPQNKNAYYLGRPRDAFALMSSFGLGILNKDLEKIKVGKVIL